MTATPKMLEYLFHLTSWPEPCGYDKQDKKFEGDSQGMAWAAEQRLPSSNREKKPYDQFEIAEKQAGNRSQYSGQVF